jgi:hypothetical protein
MGFRIVALECLAVFGQQATMYNNPYYYQKPPISFFLVTNSW